MMADVILQSIAPFFAAGLLFVCLLKEVEICRTKAIKLGVSLSFIHSFVRFSEFLTLP